MTDNQKQKYYPWIILIICCIYYGCTLGLYGNSIGIFLNPVSSDLGIKVGDLTLYITIQSLSAAAFSYFMPAIMKRFKITILLLFGILLSGLTTIAMGMFTSLYQFYIAGFLIGIGNTFFGPIVLSSLLKNWFIEKLGTVTSIAVSFSGIVGAMMNPIFSALILSHGFRYTYVVFGLILLIVGIPVCFFVRMTPEEYHLTPYGKQTYDTAVTEEQNYTKQMLMLLAVLACTLGILPGFSSQISNFGISQGFTLSESAWLVSIAMAANILFKLLIGVLADRIGIYKAAMLNALLFAVGMLLWIFSKNNAYMLMTGAALFGASYSCSSVAIPLLAKNVVGSKDYTKVYAKLTMLSSFTCAIAIGLIGMSINSFNSYLPSVIVLLAFSIIALLALTVLRKMKMNYSD